MGDFPVILLVWALSQCVVFGLAYLAFRGGLAIRARIRRGRS